MEGELLCFLTVGQVLGDTYPLVFQEKTNETGCRTVCICMEVRVSVKREYWRATDVNINFAAENFSTELKHPKFRSSVRRISVPSRTAEVSS
jgi:hypothetical protein